MGIVDARPTGRARQQPVPGIPRCAGRGRGHYTGECYTGEPVVGGAGAARCAHPRAPGARLAASQARPAVRGAHRPIEAAVAVARRGQRTVLCLDEKTALPVRTPCHPDTYGPDGRRRRGVEYHRAGTLAWYGTQDAGTGTIALRRAQTRMDSAAFTTVLDDLAAEGQDVTIIMDNGSTHTSAHTTRWIDQHPRVQVLFPPLHASWANPEEVVFSILTRQVITGGHFTSGDDLDDAAQQWVHIRNQQPLPVRWAYQTRVPRTSDLEH